MEAKKFHEASLRFALEFSKVALTQNPDTNVFLSPMSISMALATLYFGTDGPSKQQMSKSLHFDGILDNNLQDIFQSVLEDLKSSTTTSLATSVLVNQDLKLRETYRRLLDDYFKARIASVDFAKDSDEITKDTNSWVEKETNGMIPNFLAEPFDPDTKLFILNAIYFKGSWAKKFQEAMTKMGEFYNNGEDIVSVPMMWQTESFASTYHEDTKTKIIELKYDDKETSMIIFVPRELKGLPDLVANFTPEFYQEVCLKLNQTGEYRLSLSLPKFKLEHSESLVEQLKLLGMTDIFDPFKADISQMSDAKELYVSDVVHKAVIDVDEEGTTAAAATGIRVMQRSLPPSVDVDRPFLFVIRRLDSILFIGQVNKL